MTPYEIPLSPSPQSFRIALGGTTYQLLVQWKDAADIGWVLDISDDNGSALVQGIPLVTGANLLAKYVYLGFRGVLFCQTDHDLDSPPTFENLGNTSHLYFVTA